MFEISVLEIFQEKEISNLLNIQMVIGTIVFHELLFYFPLIRLYEIRKMKLTPILNFFFLYDYETAIIQK